MSIVHVKCLDITTNNVGAINKAKHIMFKKKSLE